MDAGFLDRRLQPITEARGGRISIPLTARSRRSRDPGLFVSFLIRLRLTTTTTYY